MLNKEAVWQRTLKKLPTLKKKIQSALNLGLNQRKNIDQSALNLEPA